MRRYLGTNIINGATVRSYVVDTTEEEKDEIVRGVLRVCARAKQRELQKAEEEKKEMQQI